VKFDFTITNLCPGDWAGDSDEYDAAGIPDAYFDSTIPHYYEESFSLGKSHHRTLIIAFGKRRKGYVLIEYTPLPSREHPEYRLPVTISFGTYTLKADGAMLDRRTRVLRAEGHVYVADGTDSPPHTVSCVALQLDDTEPKLQPCQPDSKQFTSQ